MKKILNLVLILIISFITCGCTKEINMCKTFKEVPYDYVNHKYKNETAIQGTYLQQERDYLLQCKIYPELDKDTFSKDFPVAIKKLRANLNTSCNNCSDNLSGTDYLKVLGDSYTFEIWYLLETIPNRVKDYNTIMETNDKIFEDGLGKFINAHIEEDIEEVILHAFITLEKKGQLKDYRVVDIFAKDVISLMIEFPYQSDKIENALFWAVRYNNDKPKALYSGNNIGNYLWLRYPFYNKYKKH